MWVDVEQSALEEDDVIRLKEYPEGEWTVSRKLKDLGDIIIFKDHGLAALGPNTKVQRWEEKNVG
jgi:hypothetical protein